MISENLSTLKIHKLTKEQYERELAAGKIDPTALYLTPDASEEIDLDNFLVADKTGAEANDGYLKLQSPLKSGEDNVYPLTTYDQIIKSDGTRWDGDIGLYANPNEAAEDLAGLPVVADYAENAGMLNNVDASKYALKTDTVSNADSLGGVPANQYALKTDTAPNANKLGGKDPIYYIQPRNLLDNSDFTNPVNQRGETSYESTSAAIYGIDRWKLNAQGVKTELISSEGIKLTNTRTDARVPFAQYFENTYIGKTLTAAVCDADTGNVYCASGVVPSPSTSTQMFAVVDFNNHTLRLEMNAAGRLTWTLMIAQGKTLNLRWAALYEGAYTADNLPPYMPKGYNAELKECLRYYQKFNNNVLFHGPASSETALLVAANTRECMRATPSLIGTPTIVSLRGGGKSLSDVTPTAASVSYYDQNGMLRLQLTTTGLTARYVYEAILKNFAISADL